MLTRGGLVGLCLLALCAARAQEAEEAPFYFPSGYASWTVMCKYHERPHAAVPNATPSRTPKQDAGSAPSPPPAAAEKMIQKIEVTETGDITQSVLTFTDGTRNEAWWLKSPPWMLYDRPDGPGILVSTLPFMMASYKPDASLFTWVNKGSFIKDVSYLSKECGYYEKLLPLEGRPPGEDVPPVLHRVWLETKTGLPVAFDNTAVLYVFTFNQPPKEQIKLPDRFRDELNRMQSSIPKLKYLGQGRSWGNPSWAGAECYFKRLRQSVGVCAMRWKKLVLKWLRGSKPQAKAISATVLLEWLRRAAAWRMRMELRQCPQVKPRSS